jgi:hypothetical protein
MDRKEVATIDALDGIEVVIEDERSRWQMLQLIKDAVGVAKTLFPGEEEYGWEPVLPQKVASGMARSAAVQTVNALLAAVSAKCHLAAPAEDIDMKLNSAGILIYRCYHDPPHEWDLTGNRIP